MLRDLLATRRVVWCGREITGQRVRLDRRSLAVLLDTTAPKNGADLQQFFCAANWLRAGIPVYSLTVAPLMELVNRLRILNGTTKSILSKDVLTADEWTTVEEDAFSELKSKVARRMRLGHYDAAQQLRLHKDASDRFYAGVLTQMPREDVDTALSEQRAVPRAFVSSEFKGTQSGWTTLEKEAFECMTRLDYLTLCSDTFIFTDHRNI